jgi:hypothetical protein
MVVEKRINDKEEGEWCIYREKVKGIIGGIKLKKGRRR